MSILCWLALCWCVADINLQVELVNSAIDAQNLAVVLPGKQETRKADIIEATCMPPRANQHVPTPFFESEFILICHCTGTINGTINVTIQSSYLSNWGLSYQTPWGYLKDQPQTYCKSLHQVWELPRSPLLFCIGLNPLSNVINETVYQLQNKATISHLFYLDDVKLHAKCKWIIDLLIHTTWIYSKIIQSQQLWVNGTSGGG